MEALTALVERLPADLPGAVLVVLHTWPDSRSLLPEILSCAGSLPAVHPRDGDPLRPGQIYVAPPDNPSKAKFRTREAMVIDQRAPFDPAALTCFISQLT